MSSYYFSPSVNEVGNLASGIYKYDFDDTQGNASFDNWSTRYPGRGI